ncbi:endonuclease domain-containing protein [Cupriavidus sp. P-10]|uniref:endonuclease domain-containing protein n=1 Tax=unclassified Cupriavidus TaxID=2640874 RepID=UPI0018F243CC|nr:MULTISPECIES: endonuclease domain-containing protein [unclassified Cupriavidus]BDB23623.1 endonuclease domain-containing protein [Cupriavidus sp. P-10]
MLRANQAEAEQRQWYHFRAHRFLRLKFKRQHQCGPYIADFICMAFKLVIEVDGGQHGAEVDAKRDAWFQREGYRVLRFWNHDVMGNTEAVLEKVREVLLELGFVDTPALSPDASPASGRGEQTVAKRGPSS